MIDALEWDEEPTAVSLARLEMSTTDQSLVQAAVDEANDRFDSECDALLRELAH